VGQATLLRFVWTHKQVANERSSRTFLRIIKNNLMKKTLISAVIFALVSFTITDELIGNWESKPSSKGNVTRVVFKSDNSFEGFINKKPFVSGKYTLDNGVLSFVDNGCDGKRGMYKLVFFSDSDSLRFEAIEDSCEQRRNGMIRTILGRAK
jgi:hypothetical protein